MADPSLQLRDVRWPDGRSRGDVGTVHTPNAEICLEVTEGKQAYPGHFVFAADGSLTMRVDPQCLANQLGEQSSLGNTSLTPCK